MINISLICIHFHWLISAPSKTAEKEPSEWRVRTPKTNPSQKIIINSKGLVLHILKDNECLHIQGVRYTE